MPTTHQQHPVPESIRTLGALTDLDYIDLFTLTTADAADWSPEQWARAMFVDVAGLGGQFIFRVLLGMQLAWRRSPDHVAGWRITGRGDDWIRLAARSWMVTGRLVVRVVDGEVSLATCVRYDRPIGARVWTVLSAKHRAVAPDLLQEAHDVLRSRST